MRVEPREPPIGKRVLLIIPNLDFGGAQRTFSNLSLELEKDHSVYVAVFNTHNGVAFAHGGQLIDLDVPGASTIIGKLYLFMKRVRRLRAIKLRSQIDVAISFLEGADYVNLLSKGKEAAIISVRGSKVHDAEISGALGWLRHRILMPVLYQRADQIVTVSEGIKEELVQYYGQRAEKIRTIYNFYDLAKIAHLKSVALPEAFNSIFRHPVIITSGRLHVQKNITGLLEVFASLPQRETHKLVVLGDGELREALVQRADELGLSSWASWEDGPLDDSCQVFFLGYQENPFRFIGRAVLYACSSSWEGFPNSLAEAMACEVPVVSTDCPTGPRELLGAGPKRTNGQIRDAEITSCGYLMPLLDAHPNSNAVQVWAAGMQPLLQDSCERERVTKNAALRIKRFCREHVFRQWEQVVTDSGPPVS
jgi:glycosyltransferase involved in cell wall biosynthesis